LKQSGDKAGKGLTDGVEQGTSKLGSKLKAAGDKAGDGFASSMSSAGSTASDALASGFDPSTIADTITGAIGNLGGKGGKIATAAAGVGLAAATAFGVGLFQGMSDEVATDKLAAQLGGGEWAEEMGDIAGSLYRDAFGESIAETGDAVKKVLQGGLVSVDEATNAEIESMTETLLTFTDVLEQDMDMTTQAVSKMLRTGIAKDGTEAFDVLTRAVQQGADIGGDLTETFQEYSVQVEALGLSAADAAGLMLQGVKAGARDADTVIDGIKEFAIRGKDLADSTTSGYERIGLSADEMRDKVASGSAGTRDALGLVLDKLREMPPGVERNAAAVELFGTKAEDMQDALFALDLDTAAAGLGTVAGATGELGSAYDNASTKIEEFKRDALAKLTEFVGNSVLPKLEGLSNWAKENPTAFKAIGVVVVGVFGAWAIAAIAAAIATSALTLPILLIGIAVAGLALLFVTHWDTIKGAVMAAFNWVKENWPLILAILTGPIGLAVLAITRNWDKIKAGVTAVRDWIGAKFNDVVSWVGGLGSRIGSAASGMWNGITGAFKDAINTIIRAWNRLSFTIGGGTYDPLGRFGPAVTVPSFTFHTPNIPVMHQGGVFRAPTVGGEGLALLRDREIVSTPEQAASGGGDTYITENHYHVAGSLIHERELDERIVQGVSRVGAKRPIRSAGRRII